MSGHMGWSELREQRGTTPKRRAAAREALENEIVAHSPRNTSASPTRIVRTSSIP